MLARWLASHGYVCGKEKNFYSCSEQLCRKGGGGAGPRLYFLGSLYRCVDITACLILHPHFGCLSLHSSLVPLVPMATNSHLSVPFLDVGTNLCGISVYPWQFELCHLGHSPTWVSGKKLNLDKKSPSSSMHIAVVIWIGTLTFVYSPAYQISSFETHVQCYLRTKGFQVTKFFLIDLITTWSRYFKGLQILVAHCSVANWSQMSKFWFAGLFQSAVFLAILQGQHQQAHWESYSECRC